MKRSDLQNPAHSENLRGAWLIAYWIFAGTGAFWIIFFSVLSLSGINFDNLSNSGSTVAARGPRGVHVFHK